MTIRTYIIAGAAVVFTGIAAFAHSGATGLVKERMEMMKDLASEMKAIAQMIKGKTEFSADTAEEAASAIAEHAQMMPDAFPEGSNGGPSEASPAIWDDWDEFVALTEELAAKADLLAQSAADAPDAGVLQPTFRDLGRTCLSCHEDFRVAG